MVIGPAVLGGKPEDLWADPFHEYPSYGLVAADTSWESGNPDYGILAQGAIDAPDSENLCGWLDLDDVIDALANGDTYVNVHTLQSLSGEIRGQLK